MKYSFKSIVALLLCIVMLGTTVLTSCDSGESSGGKDTSQSTTTDNGNENDEGKTEDGDDTDNGDKTPEDTTVVASGVTLNKSTLALLKGGSEILTATITPDNTTDKTLTWASSNTSVATVSSGTVTAVGAGAATITVTTANGKAATCEVTVSVLASGVTLDKTSIQINEGETNTLIATISPADTTDKGLTWESSNMSVATVVNGTVTAVKAGTATITVTTANEKTATCEVTVIANGISFKTLGVEGTNVYGKVSNSTTTFSFITEVGTSGNATFEVYRDLECSNIIQSKTTSLAFGDNTFYILEKIGGELNALYTVTIRRRPMYTVTFDTDGGTAVESQTIEEDSCVTVPTTSRTGYSFAGWNRDLSLPITDTTTITAQWTANGNTAYKVEYYLQNIENNDYTLKETDDLTGESDTTATAIIKTFEHFTPTAQNVTGNIEPDGSLVLKVYYTRNKYTVTFDGNGGTRVSGNTTQQVKYGGSATAPSFTRTGYTFAGWDREFNNIDDIITITAQWSINTYAITYILNDGTNANENPNSYTVENIVNLRAPTRKNYEFLGWYDGDTKITTLTGVYKDLILEAKWKSIFTVSGNAITGLTSYGMKNYTELDIPSIIDDGITITEIKASTFQNNVKLTNITIPDSVTSIGDNAFYGCANLTSITIGKGVMSIGSSAFANCTGLTEINFNATAMYDLMFSGVFSKAGKSGVGITVKIGANVTKIPDRLFYSFYAPKITSVVFADESVCEIIGVCAFQGCAGITSVTIPKSVTKIDSSAFNLCYKLVEVYNLSSHITVTKGSTYNGCIGNYALNVYTPTVGASKLWTDSDGFLFYEDGETCYLVGYTGANTDITLPASCNGKKYDVHDSAFIDCKGLTSVTIGNGFTSISGRAFFGCTGLTSITIPDSVTSIGNMAFKGCTGLTSITIPDSVTSIGKYAFEDCTRLREIKYRGTEEQWERVDKKTEWDSNIGYYSVTYKYAGE